MLYEVITGSRGWTIWNKDGSVVYDSGLSFEYAAVDALRSEPGPAVFRSGG